MSTFQWLPEHTALLHKVASDDILDSDWNKLREAIKHKIEMNISLFLASSVRPKTPEPFEPVQFPSGGLKLPPFPPRKLNVMHSGDTPLTYLSEEQANELKKYIFEQLDEFDEKPPFTIQRLCELCLEPQRHYKSVGKYLRAVEKSILVTSTLDSFPPLTDTEMDSSGRSAITLGSTRQSAPSTPLFSPIPFLHDDARRSKSRSPPPTPLALGPAAVVNDLHATTTKALGLVDEMDHPGPGHLSEHPTPLSSVTTLPEPSESKPFLGSLEQRFVKSESEGLSTAPTDTVQDDMVVDDDKENNKT
ncbi:PPP4R2-domain-containing protein [Cyathus striatus]|nr:PPP4R2-domain-containing protein [Cyathus striatus]